MGDKMSDKKIKPGRPRLPAGERRRNVTFRASAAEKSHMIAEARAVGMTLSAYIRSVFGLALLAALCGCGSWDDDGIGVLFDPAPFTTIERGSVVRVFNDSDEPIRCSQDWTSTAPEKAATSSPTS